jgi:uncharacterized protein
MQMEIIEIIFVFVIFSIAGWIMESLFRSLKARHLMNPGLLRGPYLPIYGFGALILTLVNLQIPAHPFFFTFLTISTYFPDAGQLLFLGPLLTAIHMATKGIIYIIAATSLELTAGWALDHFFNVRLWDYNDQRWTIRGYVCLKFSFYWAILAFALEYLLLPAAMLIYQHFAVPMGILSILLMEIIIGDFLIRADQLLATKSKERRQETLTSERDFWEIIEPLMRDPLVSSLEKYPHHYRKNRLEHCLEVAWNSYRIAGKFNLDARMTATGGLLHDLFHYDWLYEGPRWHGFRHPRIALENARKVKALTEKEENIILRHMWPLTIIPPAYPEAWIVSMVDKYCCAKDYLSGIAATLKKVISRRTAKFLH